MHFQGFHQRTRQNRFNWQHVCCFNCIGWCVRRMHALTHASRPSLILLLFCLISVGDVCARCRHFKIHVNYNDFVSHCVFSSSWNIFNALFSSVPRRQPSKLDHCWPVHAAQWRRRCVRIVHHRLSRRAHVRRQSVKIQDRLIIVFFLIWKWLCACVRHKTKQNRIECYVNVKW